ncbi:MAG: hypothetical protein LBG23_01460 [Endomicrobium sp.]|jgi:ADP-heptose:LPS heptosyltransferase|nr:hypothetical protein [Endomicrobium sp.]
MYQEVVKYNPFVDYILDVPNPDKWECIKKQLSKNIKIVNLQVGHRIENVPGTALENDVRRYMNVCNMYSFDNSILSSFSQYSAIPSLKMTPKFYLRDDVNENLPHSYIVFHCCSNENRKNWKQNKWNILAEKIFEQKKYVVEVGVKSVINSNSKYYINKTNLRDLHKIANVIKNSTLFLGVDSSFSHFANAFEKQAVLIFWSYGLFKIYNPYSGAYRNQNFVTFVYPIDVHEFYKSSKGVQVCDVFKAIMGRLQRISVLLC